MVVVRASKEFMRSDMSSKPPVRSTAGEAEGHPLPE